MKRIVLQIEAHDRSNGIPVDRPDSVLEHDGAQIRGIRIESPDDVGEYHCVAVRPCREASVRSACTSDV